MNNSKLADFISDILVRFEKGDDAVKGKFAERHNTELVQAIYRAIAAGDIEAFRDTLSTEIQFEIIGPAVIPFTGRAKGPNDVVVLVGHNFDQIESQHPKVQDVVAQGDTVVVSAREHGRLRDAESDYVIDWVQRFRFRDEKLVFFKQVYSTANSPDG